MGEALREYVVSVYGFGDGDPRLPTRYKARSASAAKYACYRAMKEAGYARCGFWCWFTACMPNVWRA